MVPIPTIRVTTSIWATIVAKPAGFHRPSCALRLRVQPVLPRISPWRMASCRHNRSCSTTPIRHRHRRKRRLSP